MEIKYCYTKASKHAWPCETCGEKIQLGSDMVILTGGRFFHKGHEPAKAESLAPEEGKGAND